MPESVSIEDLNLSDDAQLGVLLRHLANDKRTRPAIAKAVKELRPDAKFPDVEIDEVRQEFQAKLAEDKAEREAERTRQRLEANRAKLRDRFDDETIGKIEKDVMEKHGLTDYELAAKIYAADQPASREVRHTQGRHGTRFELPAGMDEYFKDPTGAALNNAYAVIDEMRGNRG